jgi:hypothetical protein
MTKREDEDVKRLQEAEEELRAVRRQGARMTPLINRLSRHLSENGFAERYMLAIELDPRRQS